MKALILYKDWLIINKLEPKVFDKITNGKEFSFIDSDDIEKKADLFNALEISGFIYVEIEYEAVNNKLLLIK